MATNRRITLQIAALAAAFSALGASGAARADWSHALAMHGEPALASDFPHLPYANPQAPKGGRIVVGWFGTFDSLNPFIVRGVFPPGLHAYLPQTGGYVFETLMKRNLAEPFTLYGLLAESVDVAEDRLSIAFRLNPAARFSDGRPVTAEDVTFTAALLAKSGRPNQRASLGRIAAAETIGEREVRFVLKPAEDGGVDRELPLIIAVMPILPKHAVNPDTFEETTLTPPIGTGPYVIGAVNPGSSILYRRNPNYWAKDLPIARGLYNFDEIRFDVYRDASAMFEAFKRGLLDLRIEDDATQWNEGYDFPAARDGLVTRRAFEMKTPKGFSALAFNLRRPLFADRRVREALIGAFDFAWANQNLYRGAYIRSEGLFTKSDLSAYGRPADDRERALLARFPDAVQTSVMDGSFRWPASDGSGRDREALRRALGLLREAGYAVEGGVLKKIGSGEPFQFEILVQSRDQERIALNYAQSLKRLGIAANVRLADGAQFEQRRKTFDFDMIPFVWPSSLSPGNEQSFRWSRAAADSEGSFNLPGVRSEAADAMIAAMLAARDREDLVAAARALDRVLTQGLYGTPLFHRPAEWIAHWTRIAVPQADPLVGYALETWWSKEGVRP